mgnify:CR=1 FL=1
MATGYAHKSTDEGRGRLMGAIYRPKHTDLPRRGVRESEVWWVQDLRQHGEDGAAVHGDQRLKKKAARAFPARAGREGRAEHFGEPTGGAPDADGGGDVSAPGPSE